MPIGPNPVSDWDKYNYLVIGTGQNQIRNPGVFKLLDGGGRAYKWLINDPPGMQGAYMYYRGWKLSDNIKLQFLFWEAVQVDLYYKFYDPLLSYDARKFEPDPLIVYHPILAYSQIDKIIIKEKGPLRDLGGQLWSVTHDACEWRKPPKLNVTTEPDEPQNRPPQVLNPLDARKQELLRMAGVAVPRQGELRP